MVRILRPVDESDVISAFVRAERDSLRYGERVRALLEKHAGDERAVLADERIARAAATNPELIAVRAPGSFFRPSSSSSSANPRRWKVGASTR